MNVRLEEYNSVFLTASNEWLSDPELKRLLLAPDINRARQEEWFSSLKGRKDYLIWGISADSEPIGVLGLKHVDYEKSRAEYWGYIGEKRYIGQGIGKWMVLEMEKKAESLGIAELYLLVTDYNLRARRLYERMGFHEESREGIIIRMTREAEKNDKIISRQ